MVYQVSDDAVDEARDLVLDQVGVVTLGAGFTLEQVQELGVRYKAFIALVEEYVRERMMPRLDVQVYRSIPSWKDILK